MLLADGAMGTQLHRLGASFDRCFDALNLEAAETVSGVHRSYVGAGCDLLLTNTFCANPVHLARWNLSGAAASINRAGVTIAREAAAPAPRRVFVAGSVGPTGERISKTGVVGATVAVSDVESAFRVQIEALCDAGVDLLWFETFSDLDELDLALRVAREVSDTPVVASVTFTRDGYTLHGATPEVVARHLHEQRVDGIGVNCSTGPLAVSRVVERYDAVSSTDAGSDEPFIVAKPNAGFPENRGARLYYPATPAYFAESASRLAELGARVVGGCCGTTPDHIAAMRRALDSTDLDRAALRVRRTTDERPAAPGSPEPPTGAVGGRSALATALASKTFVVTVEMEPPRSADTTDLETDALLLRQAGATVLDISDIPMARLRMTGLAAASRVQAVTGLETVLHFPVRGRNLLRVQGDLLAAHALGIRNLFVTMGDPAVIGDYPQAFDHHDIVPTKLVRLVKERFNRGVDGAGSSIGAPCAFVVGAAASLTPHDPDHEATLLHRKVTAGADFILTQPVFDAEAALAFLALYGSRYGSLPVPVLAGVLPLATVRHARFLDNEVPGMSLPPFVVTAMADAGDEGRAAGLRIAAEVVAALRDVVAGVYVIPAFRRYDLVAELIGTILSS